MKKDTKVVDSTVETIENVLTSDKKIAKSILSTNENGQIAIVLKNATSNVANRIQNQLSKKYGIDVVVQSYIASERGNTAKIERFIELPKNFDKNQLLEIGLIIGKNL